MYNRTDIDNLAKETNYIRDNVEKIVRLSGILRQLNAKSITDSVANHPMAIWKTQHIK